jgi:two-component system, LytTR family, sensor kinase
MAELDLRKRAKQFGIILAIWTGIGIFIATQIFLLKLDSRYPIRWSQVLLPALLSRWIFAILTPGVIYICSRFPFGRRNWLLTTLVHLGGTCAFLVCWVGIRMPLYPVTDPVSGMNLKASWRLFHSMVLDDAYYAFWMYGSIVAVWHLWDYYRRYKEREVRASRLESQLSQAQLKALKMQLDPNFVFSTLRSVSTLMRADVEAADDLVASLSELLRMSLQSLNEQEVSLKRELEFLKVYLEIQQIRLAGRLCVSMSIAPSSLDAMVPNMILQTFVEAALKRDPEAPVSTPHIGFRSELAHYRVRIEISGDHPWPEDGPAGPGSAASSFANARTRLQHLYGSSHHFNLQKPSGGGFLVTLDLPLRLSKEEAGGTLQQSVV